MTKQFLINYGFSDVAIEALLKKGKYKTPYGIVEIKGNELITTRSASNEVIKEKMQ